MQIENLANWNKSSRQALFGALVLIAAIALYNWIVAPHVAHLRAVQRYQPVVAHSVQEKATLQQLLTRRKKTLEDLESQFSQIRRVLYDPKQARQLFSDLDAMATEAQCVVTSMDLGGTQPTTVLGDRDESLRLDLIKMSVNTVGSYEGIMSFIGRFQAQERKIRVEALTIETAGPDARQLRCKIDIAIYVIQEKEAVPHG